MDTVLDEIHMFLHASWCNSRKTYWSKRYFTQKF